MAFSGLAIAQTSAPENWFNLDPEKDGVQGVSTEKTYKDLLKGKKAEPVVVAIIDSGVDSEHEDLNQIMWVNEDEIAENGIDDDGNGYVDDIHGWNFIGGKDGRNIHHDTYEVTRLYSKYRSKYEDADPDKLSKKERKEYEKFQLCKEEIETEVSATQQQATFIFLINDGIQKIKALLGKDKLAEADLEKVETEDEEINRAIAMLNSVMANGVSLEELQKEIEEAVKYFESVLNYHYNPDYQVRDEIVGDNYDDPYEKYYGNNDIKGPDASHGTHVAGIVAAVRNNGVGMKGVADNVRIMSVRAVPDGDERDKDVANAIIYAVDNGAKVINMSFGKSFSWNKEVVDKAIKYAMKNDVLLVHAAGNDGSNNDESPKYPNDFFAKKGLFGPKKAKNWIEVGALSWKGGKDAAATFSNYGPDNVDVFAPGVDIYSTTPEQGYDNFNGTSMASPVVAGIAAVLRSYFPDLTARQVKEIIMESASPVKSKVRRPGDGSLVAFSELCETGGVASTYEAVKIAQKTKGKAKKSKKSKAGKGDEGKKDKVIYP